MQLTVNSGGVVYFAMFRSSSDGDQSEEAAVFKFGSSRLATQSERLGIEIARHLGVATPQVLKAHIRVLVTSFCCYTKVTESVQKLFQVA